MNLLVTYDVNTLTTAGRTRLRRIAKVCQGYGQRVQFSVFECTVNEAQRETLRARLCAILHPGEDSLRIYTLRGSRDEIVETLGRDEYTDFRAPLIV